MKHHFICRHCGSELAIQTLLEYLRPGGYIRHFKVRDRRSGIIMVLDEPSINPLEAEILEQMDQEASPTIRFTVQT